MLILIMIHFKRYYTTTDHRTIKISDCAFLLLTTTVTNKGPYRYLGTVCQACCLEKHVTVFLVHTRLTLIDTKIVI